MNETRDSAGSRLDAMLGIATQRCGRCGRTTGAIELFNTEDRMIQPDGHPCGGQFRVADGRMSDPSRTFHTPRSAAVLLTDALGRLDIVEPATAREPIRDMFRATIERCTVSTSLLGQPVNYVLALAQAIADAGPPGR